MKESRFIELLNLYVDHQLSAGDAAELEADILKNPAHRKTYHQYCRMQKACSLLFEKERSNAPASSTLAAAVLEADRKIVAFPPPERRWIRGYIPIGVAAAAACIALVVARTHNPGGTGAPGQGTPVAIAPARVAPAVTSARSAVVSPAVVRQQSSQPELYSVFSTRRLSDRDNPAIDDLGAESTREGLASYAWMREVELTPVQNLSTEVITLEPTTNGAPENRFLRSRKPVQGAAELNAFQFQR